MVRRGHGNPEGHLFTREPAEEAPDTLFSQLPYEQAAVISGEIQGSEADTPQAKAMAAHDERTRERAKAYERMSDANWPQSRILEALDRQFPDLRDPEVEHQRDDAARRRQARKTAQPRRKPPTYYTSPRDTGPPSHIAKEIRGE